MSLLFLRRRETYLEIQVCDLISILAFFFSFEVARLEIPTGKDKVNESYLWSINGKNQTQITRMKKKSPFDL